MTLVATERRQFTSTLARVAPGVIVGTYKAVEMQMSQATNFAATWLGFQALWDVDVAAIAADIVRACVWSWLVFTASYNAGDRYNALASVLE